MTDGYLIVNCLTLMLTVPLIGACSVSAETQGQIDEYNRTIPTCQDTPDCRAKWNAALNWVIATPSYAIRVSNDERIETYDADTTRAGTAIQVTRESLSGDSYRFLVNIDCFATIGCPPRWPTLIDFNRAVNAAGNP